MPTFYEFFAGGGMSRMGLGGSWEPLMANDFDAKKAQSYHTNWGDKGLVVEDVANLTTRDLPGKAHLAWASFPCQDLSLAGSGRGLSGARSGTFWPFWRLMEGLQSEGRAPDVIALENVYGTLRSHGGRDFESIIDAFSDLGYLAGALLIDAVHFVPQSRLRLFIIGAKQDISVLDGLTLDSPTPVWHPRAIQDAAARLSDKARSNWVWWQLPNPSARRLRLFDIVEDEPTTIEWHSKDQTDYLLSLMDDVNLEKVRRAQLESDVSIGTLYRRTRKDVTGQRRQRAEVRFDGIAGCLRTPSGGSSRQTIIFAGREGVRTRLLSPREAARLMGLPDTYVLPDNYNSAYHLIGDGVVVPVVAHLSKYIFSPIALRREYRAYTIESMTKVQPYEPRP